jgi:predicted MFS family arabinose efflux permease
MMFRRIIDTYKKAFTGLSRETWLLSVVMLINRAGTMAVPFMGLYITHYLHRDLKDATLLISLFGCGSIAGAIAGGKLTDIYGFRPVQIVSQVASGFLLVLFAYIRDFSSLCILVVGISFVAEAFRPANFTAIAVYAAEGKLTRSYSLNRLAINLGWALGGTIGGLLAAIDYKLLFWADGGSNILSGICILFLLPATSKLRKKEKQVEQERKRRLPWQDAMFVRFFFLCILYTTSFFLVFRLVPIFWKAKWNIHESIIGLTLGLNGLLVALFEMVIISKLENRRHIFYWIVAGSFLTAISYLFLTVPAWYPVAFAIMAVIFISFGEMLCLPFINSFVMHRSTDATRGQYAAAYTITWSIAQVAGPLGGGIIADNFGYTFLWLLLSFLCLCSCYGFWQLGKKVRSAKT